MRPPPPSQSKRRGLRLHTPVSETLSVIAAPPGASPFWGLVDLRRVHVGSLLKTLGARSRLEATLVALRDGLVSLDLD